MNHPIDSDPETNPSVDPELCPSTSFILNEGEGLSTLSSSKGRQVDSKHLKLLDTFVDKIIERLNNNGCSATIWDDQLLPQDTDINIHNSLQEKELEEK